MQIVIDIEEKVYKQILAMKPAYPDGKYCLTKAIQNGTPLPEGHGRLIDVDEFANWIKNDRGDQLMKEWYLGALEAMPTVVDADVEVEDV